MGSTAIFVAVAVVVTTWLLRKIESCPAETASGKRQETAVRPAVYRFAIVTVLLGLVLRFYGFGRSLWVDEFATLWTVESDLSTLLARTQEFQPHSPFYYFVDWLFVSAFGESESVLRLPSLLAALGTLYVVFKLGKIVAGREAGLVALSLASLSPELVEQSANARPYALGILMASLTVHGFTKAAVGSKVSGRLLFIVGGVGTFAAHYVLSLISGGIALAYISFPQLRRHYRAGSFALDVFLQLLLVAPLWPQVFSVWGQWVARDWKGQPDYFAFFPMTGALLVLATAGTVAAPQRLDRLSRALMLTLWFCLAVPIGGLSLQAALGTNLINDRFLGTTVIPAVVLGAVGILRLPKSLAVFPWSYWLVATVMAFGTNVFFYGSFSQVGRQDWRSAVGRLNELVAEEPDALVLYRSGFVEDDGRPSGEVSAATFSPLRSPGESYPSWEIIPMTFRWDAPGREEYFEQVVAPKMERAPVVYFLSCQCYWEATGDYPGELYEWVQDRFPGQYDVELVDAGRGMLLMRYRAK